MDGTILKLFAVAAGGAFGSVARYLINISPIQNVFGKFPFHTFIINILGSFLIGFFLILFTEKFTVNENLRLLIMVGFLGAFTTFSTFELEIWVIVKENQFVLAFSYLFLSILTGFIGVALGIIFAKRI